MHITAGIHRYKKLWIPKGIETRPTFSRLKKSLFDICQSSIVDATFLDLFAGVGAVGLEALSRGAKEVILIEKDKKAAQAIAENIKTLGEERRSTLLVMDVFEALERLARQKKVFNIIFADPPYGGEHSLSNQILLLIDQSPLLSSLGELFLEDALKASDDEAKLSTLTLKSKRRIGRAVLRHYEKVREEK